MVTLKSRITNFSDNFFYLREKDSKTFLWNQPDFYGIDKIFAESTRFVLNNR